MKTKVEAIFKSVLENSKNILVLTGAGISAESGIPTFRGTGGFWKKWKSQDLATPEAFNRNPTLVWRFYNYRRELVRTKRPNNAHYAVTFLEQQCMKKRKNFTLVTQNVDELHRKAGSRNLIELHGSLYQVKCIKCKNILQNYDSPIISAFKDVQDNPNQVDIITELPVSDLPKCSNSKCEGLLRPNVVWFGENLDATILDRAWQAVSKCDLCLVIGTSNQVYPAAQFSPQVLANGGIVAEFNLEPETENDCHQGDQLFYFPGPAAITVPNMLINLQGEAQKTAFEEFLGAYCQN